LANRLSRPISHRNLFMNAQRAISNVKIIVLIVVLVEIAATAIPMWRSHHVSNHVVDALKAADAAKPVVMESAIVHGGLTHIEASELGYHTTAAANPYVAQIKMAGDGRIILTTKDTDAVPDPTPVLSPRKIPAAITANRSAGTALWRLVATTLCQPNAAQS